MREAKDSPDAGNIVEDHRNLLEWTDTTNIADAEHHLPINMQFNDGHRLSITVYSVLMVFSAVANITVLVLLMKRRRHQPSRINTMLMHLAIADLLVRGLILRWSQIDMTFPIVLIVSIESLLMCLRRMAN